MVSKVAGEKAESNSYSNAIPLAADTRVALVDPKSYHGNHQRWLQSLNAKFKPGAYRGK
jgi:hypothetical protein